MIAAAKGDLLGLLPSIVKLDLADRMDEATAISEEHCFRDELGRFVILHIIFISIVEKADKPAVSFLVVKSED